MIQKIINKLSRLSNYWAAVIIAITGFLTYFSGLTNPFEGDDIDQIVKSLPVHSIRHIILFFEGGTFYAGGGLSPLTGPYYRPMMTSVFSLIYSIFGPHPFYFHLFQLLIFIATAFLVYLFFRYSFSSLLSIFLALIFLVHPINSQVVFAIPSMQDALLMFFGMLAMWSLVRFKSIKALWLSATFLVLSLFSKESAVLFVLMGLVYLFWWDRQRFKWLLGIMLLPIVAWIYLRIHAVGFLLSPASAPIDRLSLGGRLFTVPSIVLFYLSKIIFPWKLATTYYWTYPNFSLSHFLLPLLIDFVLLALAIYLGFQVSKRSNKSMLYSYVFFGVWTAVGLALIMQFMALDMTACEIWFCFPFVGLLGMAGVVLSVFRPKIDTRWLFMAALMIVGLLVIRTAYRGLDYRSVKRLALVDIASSADNYHADDTLVDIYTSQNNFALAEPYDESAISVYPNFSEYINLAAIQINLRNYAGARDSYISSLKYSDPSLIHTAYEGMASLTLLSGNYQSNKQFLLYAVGQLPSDPILWTDLAILEAANGDNSDAKVAINNALNYGQVPAAIYNSIVQDKQFSINEAGQEFNVQ